jgi:hypothetical protein
MDITRKAKKRRLGVTKKHACIHMCAHVGTQGKTITLIMLVLHLAFWNELIH